MIINCPFYFEIEAKFSPEEGKVFVQRIRKFLREQLVANTQGSFKIRDDNGQIYIVKVLSEKQAADRFGTTNSKNNTPPPKGGISPVS